MGFPYKAPADVPAQEPEGGHGRGVEPSVQQPRIPVIGLDAGCIPGTRPGDSARALERAGRDIVRSHLHRNRFKRGEQA